MTTPTKVLVVAGTRPEAIKLAPVVLELNKRPEFNTVLCATAQHRDLLDQALSLFDLTPDHDLDLMRPGQGLSDLMARCLVGLDRVLRSEQPDLVLVQGDTTTALAAAMAAFHLKIDVGHIEAGLRSGDINAPWPEEFNRRATSLVSRVHFAPTDTARAALEAENVPADRIFVVGNSVVDALMHVRARIRADAALREDAARHLPALHPDRPLIVVTAHRRESLGTGIDNICTAVTTLVERDDVQVVFPVHPNPDVRAIVDRRLGGLEHVHLIAPLSYAPFVHLMDRARLILTDSGGIQEEAPALNVPVLVMRDVTERHEAITAGTARLVGLDPKTIVAEARRLLADDTAHAAMARAANPFGDGHAARRICDHLAGLPRRAR